MDGSQNIYHWYLNGEEVQTNDKEYYTPAKFGTYYCEITNSLLPQLTLKSEELLYTSIETPAENSLFYYLYSYPPYPQPTSSQVIVDLYWTLANPVKTENIEIYNSEGQKLDSKNTISINKTSSINGNLEWDTSGLNTGIYFILIKHGSSNKFIKVLVKR